jgi:hypothetical protein
MNDPKRAYELQKRISRAEWRFAFTFLGSSPLQPSNHTPYTLSLSANLADSGCYRKRKQRETELASRGVAAMRIGNEDCPPVTIEG